MANRLSADAKYSVALLEAGGRDTNPWIHIPVGYFKTMDNPKTDWRYRTQSDPGLNGRDIPWPRGRVLGGCSSINGLLYVRGQAEDFNHWRQLGNTGWAWEDVLPYFKRAETWKGDGTENSERGTDGPLSVSPTRLKREIVDKWLDAAVSAGYKRNPDYNSSDQEGVGYFQLTLDKGRRCSSAVAYLKPARNRKNLTIITHAQVERLLVEQGEAKGVVANIKGQSQTYPRPTGSDLERGRHRFTANSHALRHWRCTGTEGKGDRADLRSARRGKKSARSSASTAGFQNKSFNHKHRDQ
jgi:choline dehydrogenase